MCLFPYNFCKILFLFCVLIYCFCTLLSIQFSVMTLIFWVNLLKFLTQKIRHLFTVINSLFFNCSSLFIFGKVFQQRETSQTQFSLASATGKAETLASEVPQRTGSAPKFQAHQVKAPAISQEKGKHFWTTR